MKIKDLKDKIKNIPDNYNIMINEIGDYYSPMSEYILIDDIEKVVIFSSCF